jgi:hypothetical protein
VPRSLAVTLLALTSVAFELHAQSTPVIINNVPGLTSVLPAQTRCTGQAGLACTLPNLYGPFGLVLPNPTHTAHFNSTFQSNFSALNEAIATQLTLLPLASPASGFTYRFDPATGTFEQLRETFGPVLTERAETIGRHKFYFGATFQRFRFDKLDGVPLHDLPAVFRHQERTGNPSGTLSPAYETQFVSTMNSLDLKVNQFTIFGTFGLTSHIDVSVAVPLSQIGFNVTSNATIVRTVNTDPGAGVFAHYFDPNDRAGSLTHTFSNNQFSPDIYTNSAKIGNLYWDPSRHSAAGVGDVVVRAKGNVYRNERMSLALLTDVRFPTGDERNFLGSGAWGVKPSAAISIHTGRLTPHVNLGYQWNGASLLAGDILIGRKAKLPGFGFLSAGTDFGIARRLTLAADYIGQELINAPGIKSTTYTSTRAIVSTGDIASFDTIENVKKTYNQSNAAFGFKYNVFGRLLLSGNLLVALNDGGLRSRLAPLVGLSYSF